jgi:hypothetical protein
MEIAKIIWCFLVVSVLWGCQAAPVSPQKQSATSSSQPGEKNIAGVEKQKPETEKAPAKMSGVIKEIDREGMEGATIYALPELRATAKKLVEQLSQNQRNGPCRVALYYFTIDGRPHVLGESLAQDLGTLLALEGRDSLQVFTRRKLEKAADEIRWQRNQSGLMDPKSLQKIGEFCGVQFILLGHLQWLGDKSLDCNVQILEVKSLRIVGGDMFTIPPTSVKAEVYYDRHGVISEMAKRLVVERVDKIPQLKLARYEITYNTGEGKSISQKGTSISEGLATKMACPEIEVLQRAESIKGAVEETLRDPALFKKSTIDTPEYSGANCVLTGFGESYRDFYKINVMVIEVETGQIISGAIFCINKKQM